jgi:hypothetical protein
MFSMDGYSEANFPAILINYQDVEKGRKGGRVAVFAYPRPAGSGRSSTDFFNTLLIGTFHER